MLELRKPTPDGWLDVVLADFDAFLIDHAACERKASATGMSFVVRYPDRKEILEPLIAFAREELEHLGRSPWVETRANHYTLEIQGGSRRAAARCRLIRTPAESALPRSIAPGWVFVLAGVAETGWGACWLPGDLYRLEKSQTPLWSLGPHPLLLASVSRRSTSESD